MPKVPIITFSEGKVVKDQVSSSLLESEEWLPFWRGENSSQMSAKIQK